MTWIQVVFVLDWIVPTTRVQSSRAGGRLVKDGKSLPLSATCSLQLSPSVVPNLVMRDRFAKTAGEFD